MVDRRPQPGAPWLPPPKGMPMTSPVPFPALPRRDPRDLDAEGVTEIGWSEGVLSDGRPFRAEMWAEDGMSCLTFFFSSRGLDAAAKEEIADLLEREGLVRWRRPPRYLGLGRVVDDAGHEMFSATVVVGDDEGTFVDTSVPIHPYPPRGTRPDTGDAPSTAP